MTRRARVSGFRSAASWAVALVVGWAVAGVQSAAAQVDTRSQIGDRFFAALGELREQTRGWELDRERWEEVAILLQDTTVAGLDSIARVAVQRLAAMRSSETELDGSWREVQRWAGDYQSELEVLRVRLNEQWIMGDPGTAESAAIQARLNDVQEDLQLVNGVLSGQDVVELVAAPYILRAERDTSEDLNAKAFALESLVEENAEAIRIVREQIDGLQAAQRGERAFSDFETDLDRFGGRQTPTVGAIRGNRSDPLTVQSDTTQAAGPPRTIAEQIESLEMILQQLESDRTEFQARAAEFRRIAGGGAGNP